jgi:hypothetical protein
MRRALHLVALLVLALLAVGAASGTGGVIALGEDHGLSDNASVERFNEEGVAATNVTVVDFGLAISTDHDRIAIPGARVDAAKIWMCADYREDIPRTVKFDVPDDYIEPRPGDRQSVTSGHTIRYRPRADENATRVSIEFDGAARACWHFRATTGTYFGVRHGLDAWLNETVGFSMPSLGSAASWERVPPVTWSDSNPTQHRIQTNGSEMTMQFDNDPAGDAESWINVPTCDNPETQPVCRVDAYNETTENRTATLLSMQDDPPPVRYKRATDRSAMGRGALADIAQALGSFAEDIASFFGGGGGD